MAIGTYSELQTALDNWLNRSDLTSRTPEFIALAEADLRRQLREKKSVGPLTLTAGVASKALGATVKEIESLRHNSSSMQWPLRQKSPAGLAEMRGIGNGIPQAFSVVDGTAYFDVAPSAAYVLEMTYIEKIAALSGGSPTNTTLTNNPDLYLYGSLLQAAPFLEHDERVALWQSLYESGIEKENIYRERQEFGATPEMSLPVVFGGDDGT
jgi:hypothetical protein